MSATVVAAQPRGVRDRLLDADVLARIGHAGDTASRLVLPTLP